MVSGGGVVVVRKRSAPNASPSPLTLCQSYSLHHYPPPQADRETEFQQRLAHAREAAEREAAVTAEERARFKQLQEEMADQAAQR